MNNCYTRGCGHVTKSSCGVWRVRAKTKTLYCAILFIRKSRKGELICSDRKQRSHFEGRGWGREGLQRVRGTVWGRWLRSLPRWLHRGLYTQFIAPQIYFGEVVKNPNMQPTIIIKLLTMGQYFNIVTIYVLPCH